MRASALSIEINPEETPLSRLYDHRLRGSASAMLAALWPGGRVRPRNDIAHSHSGRGLFR